jgi:hypothetical protein
MPRSDAAQAAVTEGLAWAAVLTVACLALAAVQFKTNDPDSRAYAEISARLATLPLRSWIAPEWGGTWERHGLFREHPPGVFVLPALLARAGYAAGQSGFAIGALCSVGVLCLIGYSVAAIATTCDARLSQWAALLLPIAFVYRVRASQEYPLLFLTLVALCAVHRTRWNAGWSGIVILAGCALAFVKGVFIVFLPITLALWLLVGADHEAHGWANGGRAWLGVVLLVLAVPVLAYLYEWTYRRATGESFMMYYVADRLVPNAGLTDGVPVRPTQTVYNVIWYLGRLVWFGLPGSLGLIVSVAWLRQRARVTWRGPVTFAILVAATYVVVMSLGANKADRFIFPAYFAVGIAGTVVAARRWASIGRAAQRLADLPVYVLPLVWLVLFLVGVAAEHQLPRVKFWTT